MARHALKTWPEPFEAMLRGDKTCEVRVDDREPRYAAGDELLLRCWDPLDREPGAGSPRGYDGRELLVDATHVQKGFGLPEGMCVISVRARRPPSSRDAAERLERLIASGDYQDWRAVVECGRELVEEVRRLRERSAAMIDGLVEIYDFECEHPNRAGSVCPCCHKIFHAARKALGR